jgi:plastocyanin
MVMKAIKSINTDMMKYTGYLFLLLVIPLLNSCKDAIEVEPVNFNVTPELVKYKVGDTVRFAIQGNPETLTFYSGEEGNDYDFSKKARIEFIEKLALSFETHNQQGDGATFSVLYSTDFNGTYDYDNVSKAVWKDITSRFTLASSASFPIGWLNGGEQDIKDLLEPGKPFYIGFKYYHPPYTGTATPLRRWWRIQNFRLQAETNENNVSVLATYPTAQWKLIKSTTANASASQITGTIFLFGPTIGTKNTLPFEEWGITKAFAADAIDKGADLGVAIKSMIDPPINVFSHQYKKAGTYEAVFIAANTNVAGSNQVTKKVTVIIEE